MWKTVTATAVLLIAMTSSPVSSQNSDRPEEVFQRGDCRLAAQVLRTGHPATKAAWAMDMIRNCPDEGPAVLASSWAELQADSSRAETLADASSYIRDSRLADAALAVLRDDRRPDAVRLAGLVLLVRYLEPDAGLAVSMLVPPRGWTPGRAVRRFIGGRSTHPLRQTRGTVPLRSGLKDELREVLQALAVRDPSERMRYVAESMIQRYTPAA